MNNHRHIYYKNDVAHIDFQYFFSWNTHVILYAPRVKLVNVSLHYITKYLALYRVNLQTYVTSNTLFN